MRRLSSFVAIGVAALAFVYPVLSLLGPALESPLAAGEASVLARVTMTTLLQATLSVLGAFLLGAPIGLWIGRAIGPGARATLLSLYSMPTLVVATAVLSLLRDQPWRYSLLSVVIAHALLNAPWVALQIADGLRDLPRAWTDTARGLGADRRALLRDFTLPFLRVTLAATLLQVFTLCWMSFTLVLLLGGGPPVSTLETEIYASFRMGEIELNRAAAYALMQVLIGSIPVLLWVAVARKQARWAGAIRAGDRAATSTGARAWAAWLLFVPYVFFVVNVLSVPGSAWRGVLLGGEFARSLGWSSVLAVGTGGLTLALGILFAAAGRRAPWIGALANVPAGVSTLVLCSGFFFAYGSLVSANLVWIAIVQAIGLLPVAYRWIAPRFVLEDLAVLSAARTLGASPGRAFVDVELWKWKGVLVRVFGLAAVWSLGEYAVIAFFGGGGERELLPQYIGRLYSRYAFEEAQVASFVVFVFTWTILRLMMARGGRLDVA